MNVTNENSSLNEEQEREDYVNSIVENGLTEDMRQDWAYALRSDEYVQNTGDWYDPKTGKECCLYVLADLLDINEVHVGTGANPDAPGKRPGTRSNLDRLLGPDVVQMYVTLNDKHKLTFDEIADLIEAGEVEKMVANL